MSSIPKSDPDRSSPPGAIERLLSTTRRRRLVGSRVSWVLLSLLIIAGCGPKRLAVIGPLSSPAVEASSIEQGTRLEEPVRIDFRWELNEAGSRIQGEGVARIEPPHHARLDLFLENGESVVSAALVDEELRLPYGAPDDILPPVELMWGTLGVFRPLTGTRLVGGDRLEGRAERLRYRAENGTGLHYEIRDGAVAGLELLEGDDVVQWVRLTSTAGERYPESATYRNLVDFRELKILRAGVRPSESFDPAIWDPR